MAAKDKILVVDDEPSIRKYLQTLLEVDGFEVETVSSGKEALDAIGKGERPEFIILDVLMPEMNGLETLQQLMQVDRGAERDHAFLLERGDDGGGGNPAGRARLPDQTVREAGTRRGVSEVPAKTAASIGKPGAARVLRSAH